VENPPAGGEDEVIEALEKAASGSMKGFLGVEHEPLVSVDFMGISALRWWTWPAPGSREISSRFSPGMTTRWGTLPASGTWHGT